MILLSSCSARPNFVKLAAIHHALKGRKDIRHVIVHTGQHYDPLLSDIFFKQLEIPDPEYNLGVKSGESREETIAATAEAMQPILEQVKPDIVLVYGDVNGAVGAARSAKKLGIRIGHVEAGLRSGDLSMPEEHNRIEIDGLADLLFVSEQSGMDHLKAEKCQGKAVLVGNTMIDTLIRMKPLIEKNAEILKNDANIFHGTFAVATIHRPSNVDDPLVLKVVIDFLKEVGQHTRIVLPAHPRLKRALLALGIPIGAGVPFIEENPRDYLQFLAMMSLSTFVVTDSGGIQEEAVLLGKRCFTLRRNTERPSTIESGSNMLIDPDMEADRTTVLDFAQHPTTISVKIPALWDGKAGERIAEALSH